MADFHGSFEYAGPDRAVRQQGNCRIQIDPELFTCSPDLGTPIVFDLGDIDAIHTERFTIRIALYTGSTLTLNQLGRDMQPLISDLMPKFRDRMAKCLLVGDLEEVDRFEGSFQLESVVQKCPSCGAATTSSKFCPSCGKPTHPEETAPMQCPGCGASVQGKNFCPECGGALRANTAVAPHGGPAQIRLYKSNVGVLATESQSFQWRLADLDAVKADPKTYQAVLEIGCTALRINELGKRTEDFARKVRETTSELLANGSKALHTAFPFLNPDQLQSVAQLLREGSSAPVTKLDAIHPQMSAALEKNAVDATLKPYYDDLVKRTAPGLLYAGFKIIRPEDEDLAAPKEEAAPEDQAPGDADGAPAADAAGPATLYWFFFPLSTKPGSADLANAVAWEASSASGRATYFFRLFDRAEKARLQDPLAVADSIRRLNSVLGTLNFRRRPIYLSDAELNTDPRFHRYAIAARRIPELRQVRASLLGRAIHSSFDAWQTQVANLLDKA
ncbi:hypothetical protein Acid345_0687 [Candidatus Koribacter versatilis Ellin345]|uniref:Uncharacterized protein n=1 Tax=Koribacter versatilis (strain Ellin345) TaxID=204669 RepID=Q1ITV8_KORVE|nr:zinc ribbon domain-containing protein [Candidatus Koribacter versatilis]ABF39692.1 hypothetical protein Acid345_0687 [Candidatus Koribacter versatilis Ellin345]